MRQSTGKHGFLRGIQGLPANIILIQFFPIQVSDQTAILDLGLSEITHHRFLTKMP